MRNVTVIQGRAYFEGSQSLRVENEQGQQFINYENGDLRRRLRARDAQGV
jgi:pyruvate/2-oxoglutarate dehydrogenase complex dihydrolipoamide dehydrogenase (E3) component